ncbi:hypothetical protein ACFVZI_47585, partial [Streptomyces mirabilis]
WGSPSAHLAPRYTPRHQAIDQPRYRTTAGVLGLTDLLSLAQGELTRLAQVRPARHRAPSASRHDGMCLAA